VCVAVDRLRRAYGLPHPELAKELDVCGGLEAVRDRDEVIGVQNRKLVFVVGERLVDGAERVPGGCRIELAARLDVPPERHDMAAVPVRAGIEQVGRRHDRRARASRVRRDAQLADHVVLRRSFRIRPPARDARNERQRSQVHEHVPRISEDNRVVTP
jgi:hypothetical protein